MANTRPELLLESSFSPGAELALGLRKTATEWAVTFYIEWRVG